MARGLPKSYIKKYGISKRAWQEYRKTTNKKVIRVKQSTSSRGKRKVARRRGRKRRRRRTRTIPILPIAGFIVSTNAYEGWDKLQKGRIAEALHSMFVGWTGYSMRKGNWDIKRLQYGLLPIVAGVLAHKGLNMLGVNRYFANLPSPLNKLRL